MKGKVLVSGAGAKIIQGVKIVDGCSVGAGGIVVEDCEIAGTYTGCPAKRISD